MDDRQFDSLARAVAAVASRRLVVTGVLAGVVASLLSTGGRLVRGQQGVQLGGVCSASGANAECSQVGTPTGGVPVICSDNGVARDGQFNCCRNANGVCTADIHCCGAALCVNGTCVGAGTTGLPLGSQCTAASQCSQSGGTVVCADNGLLRDGEKNCCRNQGGSCSSDSQCCASLFCINGVCGGSSTPPPTPTPAGTGLARGAACQTSNQCSQAGGPVVCADNGYADDGSLNCCRNVGGACSDTARSADCCSGLYCRNSVCTDLSATGDLPPGSACSSSNQCSQAGGAAVCADNGIATDGALNCCHNHGGACGSGAGCCGALHCLNGICQ